MEQLFDKYKNIQKFATSPEYRNYKLLDKNTDELDTDLKKLKLKSKKDDLDTLTDGLKKLDVTNKKKDVGFYNLEEFTTKMQVFGHVMHKFITPENTYIDIYLFKADSSHISDTSEFNKMLDRYSSPHELILITKEELSSSRKKSILKHPNLTVHRYLHKNFMLEMRHGSLCSKHRILSSEEVSALSKSLHADINNLSAISIMDPQNIWVGGKIGDVIKINTFVETTGKKINYRIVVPDIKGLEVPDQPVKKLIKKTSIEKLKTKDQKKSSDKSVTFEDNKSVISNDEDYIDEYVSDTSE